MENILIIKHGALGDFVLAIGAMRALKDQSPQARFTLLTSPPFVKIAEQMDMFSDYIIDNRLPFWHIGETHRVVSAILRGRFDRIYDLQGTTRTRTYRRFWRFLAPARSFCEWHSRDDISYHMRRGLLPLLPGRVTQVPQRIPGNVTDLSFLHGEGKYFDRLPARFVLLIPGCSLKHPYKRWPVEHYREIVRRLAERNVRAVLLGTKAEADEAAAIAEGNASVVNMVGLTSIEDVPQIALRALAVVGNDTGPSHMASLTGAFTIAIFDQRNSHSVLRGPNVANLVSPGCVAEISPDEVWQHLVPHVSSAAE